MDQNPPQSPGGILSPAVTSPASAEAAQPVALGSNTQYCCPDPDTTGGGGTVTSVSGTAPIVSSGGVAPVLSITPATELAPGSMSAADKTLLDLMTAGPPTPNKSNITSDAGTALVLAAGSLDVGGSIQINMGVLGGSGSGDQVFMTVTYAKPAPNGSTVKVYEEDSNLSLVINNNFNVNNSMYAVGTANGFTVRVRNGTAGFAPATGYRMGFQVVKF